MAHLELNLSETSNTEDGVNAPVPYRETYEVLKPLFKRGRLWEPGERIDLDINTAAQFIELGEVKEIEA